MTLTSYNLFFVHMNIFKGATNKFLILIDKVIFKYKVLKSKFEIEMSMYI